MTKRRPTFDDRQLGFNFGHATPAPDEGALRNIDAMTSSAVGRILKDDPRSRYEIAGAVSAVVADDVSKHMLDAYSSEARDSHNISFGRFLALIAATQRVDVLNALTQQIGVKAVAGEDIRSFERGQIQTQIERLQERLRLLKQPAAPKSQRGFSK